jgi:hypothetical protein
VIRRDTAIAIDPQHARENGVGCGALRANRLATELV